MESKELLVYILSFGVCIGIPLVGFLATIIVGGKVLDWLFGWSRKKEFKEQEEIERQQRIAYVREWENILRSLGTERRLLLLREDYSGNRIEEYPGYVQLFIDYRRFKGGTPDEEEWASWWTSLTEKQRSEVRQELIEARREQEYLDRELTDKEIEEAYWEEYDRKMDEAERRWGKS